MTDEEIELEGARCGQATLDAQLMLNLAIERIELGEGATDRFVAFFVGYMGMLRLHMHPEHRRAFMAGVLQGAGHGNPLMVDYVTDLMDQVEEKLKSRQMKKGELQ